MKTFFRKPVVIILAVVAVVALWAAFRPELLFVHTTANDPFPTSVASSAPSRL
jgi:hypothetical protein